MWSSGDPGHGYVEGGRIPRGQAFLIERIEWTARCDGEGKGEFLVSVGPFRIVHGEQRDDDSDGVRRGEVLSLSTGVTMVTEREFPVRGAATVRIPIPSGEESSVFAEVGQTSALDVTLTGRFVPVAEVPAPIAVDARHGEHHLRSLAFSAGGPPRGMGLDDDLRAWFRTLLEFGLDADLRERVRTVLEAASPPRVGPIPSPGPPAPGGRGGAGGRAR